MVHDEIWTRPTAHGGALQFVPSPGRMAARGSFQRRRRPHDINTVHNSVRAAHFSRAPEPEGRQTPLINRISIFLRKWVFMRFPRRPAAVGMPRFPLPCEVKNRRIPDNKYAYVAPVALRGGRELAEFSMEPDGGG
ncbi:hypothetical protein EVAR_51120_1 [Eumeta japonica]|uniref:Uncharacterized protein n=1 Tax=Eumeta variegata TaxID=151549 RepID=A0A4C1YA05_EUMVA|nr:hypothetical protein EVAR_51120_1 [Eumeta japonica]